MFSYQIDQETSLKLLEIRDAEKLFRLIDQNRLHLRQWLPFIDFTKKQTDTQRFIRSSMKQFGENDGFQAGIWYRGQLAGVIGLHNIDWANRKTSVGYWLGQDLCGKGIMTKSCQAIINYVFKELRLNRVEIRVAVSNVKSKAIPERLGFQWEGQLRDAEWLYDHFVDHAVYGLRAKDQFPAS